MQCSRMGVQVRRMEFAVLRHVGLWTTEIFADAACAKDFLGSIAVLR